ncbi:MAG TPA: hypothetical protein VG759_08740 [Candidatus Angelobacter sp.]|jgi:hypothetical protein|nr:hypothetical protein [Candidatus Angelobacter sp.]
MKRGKQVLILGGIALALWGMSYGLWYAVFAEHQALDGIGSALAASFGDAAQRHVESADANLVHYREAKYVYDRQVDVHSHWIGLAMLLLILGIAYDHITLSERWKLLLAIELLIGAIVFPLGVLLQTSSHGPIPRGLAIAGSVLVIASLVGMSVGFVRRRR